MASIARNVLRRGYATASSVKVCIDYAKTERAISRAPAIDLPDQVGAGRKLLLDLGTVVGDEKRMRGGDVDASALGRYAARLFATIRARRSRRTDDWT